MGGCRGLPWARVHHVVCVPVSYSLGSASRNRCVTWSLCASRSGPLPGCPPQRPPPGRAGGFSCSSWGTWLPQTPRRAVPGRLALSRCCVYFSPADCVPPRVLAVWPASSLAPWTGPPSELRQSPQPLRLLLPRGDPSPPPGEERAPQSPSLLPGRVCAVRVPRGPWSRKRSSSQHKDGEMPAPAAGCS